MSIRSQINFLITLLMMIFVVALVALEIDAARRSIREESEAATKVTVQLLSGVIVNYRLSGGVISPRSMVGFLQRLGRVRATDIRLYNAAREALYASPPSLYKAGRNAPRWFSRLVSPQTNDISLRVDGGALVIAPDISRSVLDAWDDLRSVLWLAAGFFVTANVLVFWFAGRALHPVKAIVDGLKQMEQGQFHARLPRFALREMASISEMFNRMAQAVEESFAVKKRAEQTEYELQQNRELTHLIQHHVEDERRHLALELHDELGQSVTAIKTIATSIVNLNQEKQRDIQTSAQTIVSIASQMYDAMHGMVRRLRPLALDNLGLKDALHELIANQAQLHPEIAFDITLEGDLERLGEDINITTYRIVQECLTNIVRHASATRAEILVRQRADRESCRLEIAVRDDGKGLSGAAPKDEHFGVLGMRERVQALGGEFVLENQAGKGVSVRATLPCMATSEIAA